MGKSKEMLWCISIWRRRKYSSATEGIESSYQKEVFDEFVVPSIIGNGAKIEDGDSVIFYNFRPDRAREITRALVDPEFDGFETKKNELVFCNNDWIWCYNAKCTCSF